MLPKRPPSPIRTVAAGLALALVAAACATARGTEPDPTAATTVPASTTPPTTPTTAPPADPLPPPTPAVDPPPPTPEPSPPAPSRRPIVIHATGDVSLDPAYVATFGSEGYDYAWSGLEGLFVGDDLTIINLECAVSELGAPLDKEFTFRCDPEALPAARAAGVDVANLANNHSGDYGSEAAADSRLQVEASGIAPVGVGRDVDEAYAPAFFEAGGWKIAVIGLGAVIPSTSWVATEDRAGQANGHDVEAVSAAIETADEAADVVLVTIHWGHELDTRPVQWQIELAEAMIDAGADAIFGHHSHRLNPIGWYRGRPIAWGLGNFVWPRLSTPSATTAVAEVVVRPDGRFDACLIPAFIADHGHPVIDEPYRGACMAFPG